MKDEKIKDSSESKESEVISSDKKDVVDSTAKELDELRKFKQEVEAKQKAESEKPETVDVSGTFFSTREKSTASPKGEGVTNSEKIWEKYLDRGIPRRHD